MMYGTYGGKLLHLKCIKEIQLNNMIGVIFSNIQSILTMFQFEYHKVYAFDCVKRMSKEL